MSKKRKYKYGYNYGNTFPNFYMLLILVLIVLQWLRVSPPAAVNPAPEVLPEPNLMTNGGLFIITLFILVVCSCELTQMNYRMYVKHHQHR